MIKGPTRKRIWKADPWLDDNETLEPKDYEGASEQGGFDRGHQAPLASFSGTDSWFELNYLSNITPQKADLNRGAWEKLEQDVRDLLDSFDVAFVMTGPLYEKDMGTLPGANESLVIPSGYWKIIIVPLNTNKFESAAFIFEQSTDKNDLVTNHITTIDEIEKRSKLNFLWLLDKKTADKVESETNTDWIKKEFTR